MTLKWLYEIILSLLTDDKTGGISAATEGSDWLIYSWVFYKILRLSPASLYFIEYLFNDWKIAMILQG